jgi:hypothetical protein
MAAPRLSRGTQSPAWVCRPDGWIEWSARKGLGRLMLHKNSRQRYEKLLRSFRRLMQNFNVDDLDDFIATANSMPEWMKNDPSLSQEQRDAIGSFTDHRSLDWQICKQIANRQKHVKPQRTARADVHVKSCSVRPGRGVLLGTPQSTYVIGAGEEILVDLGGSQESALGFVIRIIKHFHYMFEMIPLPRSERNTPTLEELIGL